MDLAARLFRLRSRAPSAEQEKPSLSTCPGCGSGLVQPEGWRELPGGGVVLRLRCPECMVLVTGTFEPERVAEYDDALVKGRASIIADYEAVVRHNMKELCERFRRALELDLIGPDDFAAGVDGLQPRQTAAPARRVESV